MVRIDARRIIAPMAKMRPGGKDFGWIVKVPRGAMGGHHLFFSVHKPPIENPIRKLRGFVFGANPFPTPSFYALRNLL
jgi:hypothetical protein